MKFTFSLTLFNPILPTLLILKNQTGSLNTGHYTAYIKKADSWYYANDSQVKDLSFFFCFSFNDT
jgi:ubiquitin C-terminal hydrolase